MSDRELAEAYHLNRHTVAKWRQREGVEDTSHRPQRLHATLSTAQEAVVVALRETLPRTPQTNGMSERFNGCSAEVLATTRFDSAEHLADTIKRYVKVYNQHIPQKALGYIPPLQAMKYWSQKQTQLFKKCVYNLEGLDNRTRKPRYVRVRNSMINQGIRKARFMSITMKNIEHGIFQGPHYCRTGNQNRGNLSLHPEGYSWRPWG